MVLNLVSIVRVKHFILDVPHRITDCNRTRVCVTQGHCVTELCGRGCWVTESNGSVDGVRAVRRVQVLPGPPHAVDLRVMEVEPRVVSVRSYFTLEL
jgi:hypothetical protein